MSLITLDHCGILAILQIDNLVLKLTSRQKAKASQRREGIRKKRQASQPGIFS